MCNYLKEALRVILFFSSLVVVKQRFSKCDLGTPDHLRDSFKGYIRLVLFSQNMMLFAFSFSFSHKCTLGFSRCCILYDIATD